MSWRPESRWFRHHQDRSGAADGSDDRAADAGRVRRSRRGRIARLPPGRVLPGCPEGHELAGPTHAITTGHAPADRTGYRKLATINCTSFPEFRHRLFGTELDAYPASLAGYLVHEKVG